MAVTINAHKLLTWVAGIGSAVTVAAIVAFSDSFIQMRDTLIRMEDIPAVVKKHDIKLYEHDIAIIELKRNQPNQPIQ